MGGATAGTIYIAFKMDRSFIHVKCSLHFGLEVFAMMDLDSLYPLASFSIITASLQVEMTECQGAEIGVSPEDGEEDANDMLFFDEIGLDEDVQLPSLESFVDDSYVCHTVSNFSHVESEDDALATCEVPGSHPVHAAIDNIGPQGEVSSLEVNIPGLRVVPDKTLHNAGKGEERQASERNDQWALKRANSLRVAKGWDMSVSLGDLSLQHLDELFSDLFSRAVKVNGQDYPNATLMNMCNGFNRLIKRSSELRSLRGEGNLIDTTTFNIKTHVAFSKTRMVLRAAIKKASREGKNKKRKKVETITEEMEQAILADIDHQISSAHGCQKRLAFYFLCRLGIRGGKELWLLQRNDIRVESTKEGQEYVRFEERESKNNSMTLDRYSEHQFRNAFHSFEADFILCVKQYLRHMAPAQECKKQDLFMQPITNPAGNVWYNKCHKVAQDRTGHMLNNMLQLVGLPKDLFTNKSGRVTLMTRMAAKGVPYEVGMLVTGHHTTSGYLRYDRTQDLKQEAATLVGCNSNLSYEKALTEVSKQFYSEKVAGSGVALNPLIDRVSVQRNLQVAISPELTKDTGQSSKADEEVEIKIGVQKSKSVSNDGTILTDEQNKRVIEWNRTFDEVDYVGELSKSLTLAGYFAAQSKAKSVSVGNSLCGNYNNCTINFIVKKDDDAAK